MKAKRNADKRNASYRKWYAANREEFNARRRARYAADPEFRENVLAKQSESKRKRNKDAATANRGPKSGRRRRVAIGSRTEPMDITQVGACLAISAQTVRLWVKNKVIPDPRELYYRDEQLTPQRKMLFPVFYVARIIKMYDEHRPTTTVKDSTFSKELWAECLRRRDRDMARVPPVSRVDK